MARTPEEIRREHEERLSKMHSDTFGTEQILPPPPSEMDMVAASTSDFLVSQTGVIEVEEEQSDDEPSQEIPSEPEQAIAEPPELPAAEPPQAEQPEPQLAVQQPPTPQPAAPAVKPPKQGKRLTAKSPTSRTPSSVTQDYLKNRFGTTSMQAFLANRFAGNQPRPQQFAFNGTDTSTATDNVSVPNPPSQPTEPAGRPQPPPEGVVPSHPFRLLNNAPPASTPHELNESLPNDSPHLGQHPQEGKRQQGVAQASNLAESLDMAVEQTLMLYDRMAQKLYSYGQRLSIIESILQRSS